MRILENTPKKSNEIFHLKKKKYYNLVSSVTRSRENILTKLLEYLDNLKFTTKVRYIYIKNKYNVLIKRIL